ncbi:MAG: twin-arginine translocation signal domain-containing protein [Pirellulales bacterium]
MNLKPDEKATGQENYYSAVSAYDGSASARPDRRDFLKTVIATSAVAGASLGAQYFGYKSKPMSDPLRVAVIGTGDEGSVLIQAL